MPEGTVAFLFTDVEGSTRLLESLGPEAYADALARHRAVIRRAAEEHGGAEVDTQGDAFFLVFPTADSALAAAVEIRDGLVSGPIRIRSGIHVGAPLRTDEGYVGISVHHAARIGAVGHGGQIVVSDTARALLSGTADLHDLGLHRLKDVPEPQRLFQVGQDAFAPLKTLGSNSLPLPATTFVGREAELAELLAVIQSADTRLVTLTGPGGSGKTRLALAAGAELAGLLPGGVTWVPLASVARAEHVLAGITAALGLRSEGRPPLDALAEWARRPRSLLVLDNFEHVIDAAPDVARLLAACPEVVLLVTSREALRVGGEQVVPVEGLSRGEAVELFVSRAVAADPAFVAGPVLDELCDRLDRLPLAIELAAARVRLLGLDGLVGRLGDALDLLKGGRDADTRQQTLRATIAWSHDLLTDEERRLFRRLAVFVDCGSVEAIGEVCDADLDTIGSLHDKSLIRRRQDPDGTARFGMLSVVRAFALEELERADEGEELRDRHALWHARWAAVVGDSAIRYETWSATVRFGPVVGELRAAFDRLLRQGRCDELLAGLTPIAQLWYMDLDPREAQAWVEGALPCATDDQLRRKGEIVLSACLINIDTKRARALAERNVDALDDPLWQAYALVALGNAVTTTDPAASRTAFEHVLEIARQHDYVAWERGIVSNLAATAIAAEEWDTARELALRAIEIAEPLHVAAGYLTLGLAEVHTGDPQAGLGHARQGLEAGSPAHWLPLLCLAAEAELALGRAEVAGVILGHAEAVTRARRWKDDDDLLRPLAALAEALPDDVRRSALAAGAALDGADAEALALGLRPLPPLAP